MRLEPKDADTHYYLGMALTLQGKVDAAVQSYREALRLKPNWPAALNDLAWLLATQPQPEQRNGAEAVTLAERACALTQRHEARYLGTLDAAYAEAGRFSEPSPLRRNPKRLPWQMATRMERQRRTNG